MSQDKLLFVVGIQKSGTSLLNRMLTQQSFIVSPFIQEGRHFWGDNPPFSPEDEPCGSIYQKYNGEKGHHIGLNDFTISDQNLLRNKISNADIGNKILMNKNPYNTVRVRWLKKIFPGCKIVSMYRYPVSNVFSLLKKYVFHENRGLGPENGWWGIKPLGWQKLVSEDKIKQCALQWNAVYQELLKEEQHIDMLINYETLCEDPNSIIKQTLSLFNESYSISELPKCKNMNGEFETGSRLLSKNREYKKRKNFNLDNLSEDVELNALSQDEIVKVLQICDITWQRLLDSDKNLAEKKNKAESDQHYYR